MRSHSIVDITEPTTTKAVQTQCPASFDRFRSETFSYRQNCFEKCHILQYSKPTLRLSFCPMSLFSAAVAYELPKIEPILILIT